MVASSGHKIFVTSLFVAALIFASSSHSPVRAQEGDNIEGAIWQFELTKKGRSPSTVKGQFRVSDDVVYQKERKDSPSFSKKVGTNKPNGRRTRTEFEGLRVFDAERNPSLLNGVARLQGDKFGEWSGNFTDSDGANWEMKLSRVKE